MAHWNGLVKFPNGQVFHFEYNGVADVAVPVLRHSRDELEDHWREEQERTYCTCETVDHHQPIEIAISYGTSWPGMACYKCLTIVKGLVPPSEPNDMPEWAAEIFTA